MLDIELLVYLHHRINVATLLRYKDRKKVDDRK